MNDVAIGTSPVLFTTPTKSLERSTFHYRVEADGYVPAEGELKERVSAGRIVGYVFTVGILRAFRGVKTFREPVEITLQPVGATAHAASTALEARLNELKSLHDRGVISDEEYRQARAAALKGP
ncbi:MAG: SHOCT domain-containing protein [Deltaproteobacteria bacterium]|nr:SHOCT domain-containing protein [Deltaproteobacteria bacterium]MBI3386509.1 SHOCT domain-containing protein [Deltaproteobacteria bacterium]